jgi:membrane-associated protein
LTPFKCAFAAAAAAAAAIALRFALYNVVGALVWTVLFLGAGFFFGNLPVVQHNFTLVVLGIVAVSVLPVLLEVLAARREHGQSGGGAAGSGAAA